MAPTAPLPASALRTPCDPASLDFETTEELEDLPEILGQPRAAESLRFGVGMRQPGFNLFVLGPRRADTHDVVLRFLAEQGAKDPVPADWVYVHDFEQPYRPRALPLPPGRGAALAEAMRRLVEDLQGAIPAAFETDEYRSRAQVIEEELKERHQAALAEIEREARERGLAFLRTPMGMAFAPTRGDAVLGAEEFAKLPAEERDRITREIQAMQERLQEVASQFPRWQREGIRRFKELAREFARSATRNLIDELRSEFADLPAVLDYLDRVEADVVEHVDLFRRPEPAGPTPPLPTPPVADGDLPRLDRYRVNVLVDHGGSKGAPVVYEPHPTYENLVGRVEHRPALGTLVTDFTLIKPGALHRANGGYLVLEARKVLTQPWAWEGLKQALRGGRIRIESLGQIFGLISTVSLEPEHIPLELKVVLLDEPWVYHLLHAYDPDFAELFKVVVDFDDRMARTTESSRSYARLIGSHARRAGLRPFSRQAVARLIDESARQAGDAERLSALTRDVADLVAQADYWAGQAGRRAVGREDVQRAIDAAIYRLDRIRERLREETERGTILIDTAGSRVGQINGLAVYQLGDLAFGRPSRITARTRVGSGQVIDIEREVQLGGPIHSKGVLILSSFLASRYAADIPLSLAASLVFEQSYSGIDGDSASAAELFALLSALSGLPIRQDLAVTGSVNQLGEVQAIGGVNEKVEGFFDLCRARGLSGSQGVLIPAANVKHLMLREDVVEAVAAGRFSVFAVATIDEGIELLTGVPAGEPGEDGSYPEGTVNRFVRDRLVELAELRRRFSAPPERSGDGASDEKHGESKAEKASEGEREGGEHGASEARPARRSPTP